MARRRHEFEASLQGKTLGHNPQMLPHAEHPSPHAASKAGRGPGYDAPSTMAPALVAPPCSLSGRSNRQEGGQVAALAKTLARLSPGCAHSACGPFITLRQLSSAVPQEGNFHFKRYIRLGSLKNVLKENNPVCVVVLPLS